MKQTIFKGRVVEVSSGDDLMVEVDLGVEGLYKKTRVRLKGVDAPDAYKAAEESAAYKVKQEVSRMVNGKDVTLDVVTQGSNKSGWVAHVYLGGSTEGVCLNEVLRNEGYVYLG